MSTEQYERIFSMQDARMTRIEEALHRIEDRLNAHPPCPSPGACIGLTDRLQKLESRLDDLDKEAMNQSKKFSFREGWLIGGAAVIMLLINIFAPVIRRMFHLE